MSNVSFNDATFKMNVDHRDATGHGQAAHLTYEVWLGEFLIKLKISNDVWTWLLV